MDSPSQQDSVDAGAVSVPHVVPVDQIAGEDDEETAGCAGLWDAFQIAGAPFLRSKGGSFAFSNRYHTHCTPFYLKEKEKAGRLDPAFDFKNWLRGLDLNQRPSGYEPDELPDCSTPRTHHSGSGALRQTEREDGERAHRVSPAGAGEVE
jgi:hypothetical protein